MEFEVLRQFFNATPGFNDFMLEHRDIQNFAEMIDAFRGEKLKNGELTEDLDLMLKILDEKCSQYVEESSGSLHFLNKHLQVDDSAVLSEFVSDLKGLKRGEVFFKKADLQRYRTIREEIAYFPIDFSPIVDKYMDETHPYITSKFATAYLEAKNYDIGLVFLQKSLNHVFARTNIYWHNPLALYGCVDALHRVQYIMGRRALPLLNTIFPGGYYDILRLLFLYLSRAIHMCDSENYKPDGDNIPKPIIEKINYLLIRADLVKFYSQEFVGIFGIGVNPDIQFISDKISAYYLGCQWGLGSIVMDSYKEAMTLYRNGSFTPNYSGGYVEIEDATIDQLVVRGQLRADNLAKNLYELYQQGSFCLPLDSVADLIAFIKESVLSKFEVSYESFIEKRKASFKSYEELLLEIYGKAETSEEDRLYAQSRILKDNAADFENYLRANGIQYLYHFTDRRNLESIIKHRGLLSWKYCVDHNISIPNPGGSAMSRELDTRYGLADYVRLSFCDDHPMAWRLKMGGGDLVLLKIRVNVAWRKDTLFSDINAADSQHRIGDSMDALKKVNMNSVKKHYVRRDSEDFKPHQAEVLVKDFIPIEDIVNINSPQTL